MEQPEQPELKWVSEHKIQEEEEEEEEVVGLQARRSKLGHGQNGDHFDGNGSTSTVTSTNTSPSSGSLKNGAESRFQFTDIEEGLGGVESHIEEHADAGEAELKINNSVYYDRDQGTESANGFSEIKSKDVESFPIETKFGLEGLDSTSEDFGIQKNLVTAIENEVEESLEAKRFSDPSLGPVGKSHGEENANVENLDNNTGVDEVEEEFDLDVPDLDVEGVIAKQETHDLICPNCRCPITKTVILQRRKLRKRRKVRRTHDKPSKEIRPVLDASPEHLPVADDQGEGRVDASSTDGPAHVTDGEDQDRKTDVLTCLSCLSFFIPTGNGLFRIFKGKKETETTAQNPPATPAPAPAPAASTNSFFTLFGSNKGTVASNDKTTAALQEANTVEKGNSSASLTSNNIPSSIVIEQPAALLPVSTLDFNGQPAEAIKATQDGLNGVPHSVGESLVNGKPEIKVNQGTDMSTKYEILPDQNGLVSVDQPLYRIEVENGTANVPQKVGTDAFNSSTQEYKQSDGAIAYVPEKVLGSVEPTKTGSSLDVIVTGRGSEPAAPTRTEDVNPLEEPLLQTETRIDMHETIVTEPSEPRGWDILKSIVYGGLIESITSLGIVSSAAGAGTGTLNIMVLGVANLIGGLFVIAHNLGELKKDTTGETSTATTEPQGRYFESLGRREKFKLHAVVVILSFLIFGALPPVIYGFSFRQSNDRDYKLAFVAASSLVCIALLATGKSHVQKPPKSYFKTVLYYVTLGFMASGASYLVGVLLDKLFKDLGLNFDSSSVTVTDEPFQAMRWEPEQYKGAARYFFY